MGTPVAQGRPARQGTAGAAEIDRRSWEVDTCLRTACHGSVADCSQMGVCTLFQPVGFGCVCCCHPR